MPLIAPPPAIPPVVFTGRASNRQGVALADPRTLRRTTRVVRIPGAGLGVERSPDGRRLAVMQIRERDGGRDVGSALTVMGVRSWTRLGTLKLGLDGPTSAFAWVRDDRLLLAGGAVNSSETTVAAVDARTRRIVRRVRVPGEMVAVRQVGDRLALVTYDEDAAAVTLHLVDADLGVTTVPLPMPAPRTLGADIEQDPVTGHVLVLLGSAAAVIADVDPVTGLVATRTLPAAGNGPFEWRGPRVVVRGDNRRNRASLQALDDTGAVVRTVRLGRSTALRGSGPVLALGRRGVAAFGGDGRPAWSARGPAVEAAVAGDRAYVLSAASRRPRVVVRDAASGKRVGAATLRTSTRLVLEESDGPVGIPFFAVP